MAPFLRNSTPTPALQLQYPVVLIHGIGALRTYGPIDYFYRLPRLLREANNTVYTPQLTPFQRIEFRANQLKEYMTQVVKEEKVNLVGHSLGGLDARYLVSQLGLADRVASVTTIGTPNHGSSIGDIATGLLPEFTFSLVDQLLRFIDSSSGAFLQVTRQYCTQTLNTLLPRHPGVAYFSATSAIAEPFVMHSLPLFWIPQPILAKLEGENDGFVSVESAKWGDHICTYSGDHYSQIGQILGRARGMDYLGFYHEIFSHLKAQGM